MDNNLVNGWYKCIKSSENWTEGEFYYFKDGFTKDDKGLRRPSNGASPQMYNDKTSKYWFEGVCLVPADENEVRKIKHDNMEDYRINGFYKATKTDAAWSKGKQYYFRDGRTVDDNGLKAPFDRSLMYGSSYAEEWLEQRGLIPVTDERDIFDRVNEAAVNCTENHLECNGDELNCPYWHTPNCKDQMISDFKALREMRKNQKEQEHEAMPIQGGFVYQNKRESGKGIILGCFCRNKETFEVFRISDIVNNGTAWYSITLVGVSTGVKRTPTCIDANDFYKYYEHWNPEHDGGDFDFFALEDLCANSESPMLFSGHAYCVADGKILGNRDDRRFRSYEELAKHFGEKTIQADYEKNCQTEDPAEGLYTGYAIYTGGYSLVDAWFTIGRVYRFTNGLVKRDAGDLKLLVPTMLTKYFRRIVNMVQPTRNSCESDRKGA